VQVVEKADAKTNRRGRDEALALARSADKVLIAKGKRVIALDMKADKPDDETLAGYLLGPAGNLRAPTIRRGKSLLVGFSDDAYRELLGK